MTFDQTILLIVSQICIDTNLEFDIIKKATKCATMFIIHTITNLDWTRKQLFTTEFLQFYRCQKFLDWSKNILDL